MNEDIKKLEKNILKIKKATASVVPSFSYYEQELVRRVFKSILPQLKNFSDISTAKEILKKTDWLESR